MATRSDLPATASDLLALLPLLAQTLRDTVQSGTPDERLTGSQYRTLAMVAPRPRASSEIAQHLGVTASAVTSIVDILVQRKLVERSEPPQDRRRVEVRITPAGKACLKRARQRLLVRLEGMLGELADSDREMLAAGLAALRRVVAPDEAPKDKESLGAA